MESNKLSIENVFKNVKYRMLIFIIFCIGARLGLAYLAAKIPDSYLTLYSAIIGLIGVSFLFLYFTDGRKTGAETGGNTIWWSNLRPIHGIMYVVSGSLLLYKYKSLGSKFILVDTLIGLIAFLVHHIKQGDIK